MGEFLFYYVLVLRSCVPSTVVGACFCVCVAPTVVVFLCVMLRLVVILCFYLGAPLFNTSS